MELVDVRNNKFTTMMEGVSSSKKVGNFNFTEHEPHT
jgi:hypothetical protein